MCPNRRVRLGRWWLDWEFSGGGEGLRLTDRRPDDDVYSDLRHGIAAATFTLQRRSLQHLRFNQLRNEIRRRTCAAFTRPMLLNLLADWIRSALHEIEDRLLAAHHEFATDSFALAALIPIKWSISAIRMIRRSHATHF